MFGAHSVYSAKSVYYDVCEMHCVRNFLFTVQAKITKGKYPKKKINAVLVIVVSPQFLGPKIFIICSPTGPCFLCGLLLPWMGMFFPLWWWMRTG